MKKIMFNDKYGLTKAVLEGRKTQTRRIITTPRMFKGQYVAGFHVYKRQSDGFISEVCMYDEDERDFDEGQIVPKYKTGEIVAIAQSYKSIGYQPTNKTSIIKRGKVELIEFQNHKGWNNKMFVSCDNMLHFIRITNVRIERLQDISDDDCFSEGVVVIEAKVKGGVKSYYPCEYLKSCANKVGWGRVFDSAKKAYAELIDKVSGKGTWQSNPYVFVYDFELIK